MLMGDTVFSEYSKITVPDDIQEAAFLDIGGSWLDVSRDHWLLCIEPIVFGVWIRKDQLSLQPDRGMPCRLYFGGGSGEDRKRFILEAEVALTLELTDRIGEEGGVLFLFRLRKSRLHHFAFIKIFLLFFRYYRRGGLSFDRFKAFVAAYNYPRRVRLISFREENYFNIFPMDLLGEIAGTNRYVFGLRHSNTSLPKILKAGKILVSEVADVHKDIVYQLGKHHSGHPPSLEELPFGVLRSKNFDFYVPSLVESYKEVRIVRTMNLGSHMLLWGEIVGEQVFTEPGNHLYLVHFLHFLYQKDRQPYRLA